jgi:O-glycosyl hydrolase
MKGKCGWVKRLLLLAFCLASWSETWAVAEQPGTSTFQVHPELTFQTMVGFGAGFNSSRYIDAIKKPADRERAYDLLFGDLGVRLNIVRLTISPDAHPLDATGHHYNWAADERTLSAWKAVQSVMKRTKPILYVVPFTPPARWKNTGRLTNGGSLKAEYYQDYAEYLVDFLDYYHKVLGVDINILSLQNEPGIAAPWESCVWTGAELRDFLKILAPAIRARGLNTQLMLSEGTSWTGAWEHLIPTLQDPEARPFLNIMASHSYGSPEDKTRGQFAAASGRNGLPVWMTEMSLMIPPQLDDPSMNAAIRIARYLHRDLVEGHASAWIYCFAIFTSTFKGSMGVLSPADMQGSLKGQLVVPKRFWAMANYSRFVRPGWKLMQVDGQGIDSTGFVSPGGESYVIVAVNSGATSRLATYEFGDQGIGTVEAYSTTAELNLDLLSPPETHPNRFVTTLAPMSVTTFVVSKSHPTTVPQEPPSPNRITYVEGSSQKVCQITGEIDKEFNKPTVNQTQTRWGLMSTDGGYSFEHNGKLFMLFGDSNPTPTFRGKPNGPNQPPRNWEYNDGPTAFTTDTNIEQCLKFNVITNSIGAYKNPVVLNAQGKPAVKLRINEGPVGGFSQGGKMYVMFMTDNFVYPPGPSKKTGIGMSTRLVLAVSNDDGNTFHYLYDLSKGPDGKFVNAAVAHGSDGYLYFWGVQAGKQFRKSAPYFARKKDATIDRPGGFEYFIGFDISGRPRFSASEAEAEPLFHDYVPDSSGQMQIRDCMGEAGVEWNRFLHRWVMLYNCANQRKEHLPGIWMRVAERPWGPWSEPQTIFNPVRDKAFCHFIHRAVTPDFPQCDNLSVPEQQGVWGAPYGPFFISRFTTGDAERATSTFYYTISTWNPYQKVIMKTTIQDKSHGDHD